VNIMYPLFVLIMSSVLVRYDRMFIEYSVPLSMSSLLIKYYQILCEYSNYLYVHVV
jgi:hypothetical protein